MSKPKVLFITRKYPPQKGGMENMSYGLINNYPGEKQAIILNKKQIHLLWFYPYALIYALWTIGRKGINLIHLSDGVMAPLGYVVKKITKKPVVITAHGLDINFNYSLYRWVMPFFFRQMNHVICVSQATKEECIKVGIDPSKTTVIHNGINPQKWHIGISKEEAREKLEKEFDLDLKNTRVLLSVGRLARRKGFRWFIENVMPRLSENFVYLIVGGGKEIKGIKSLVSPGITEEGLIRQSIRNFRLKDRVILLGTVCDSLLRVAYRAADIFVMPNISVRGDMEGFGIVALEAGISGLPTVASRIEGITDAVIDQQTGILCDSENADSFIENIHLVQRLKRNLTSKIVESRFGWERIARNYQDLFYETLKVQPGSRQSQRT